MCLHSRLKEMHSTVRDMQGDVQDSGKKIDSAGKTLDHIQKSQQDLSDSINRMIKSQMTLKALLVAQYKEAEWYKRENAMLKQTQNMMLMQYAPSSLIRLANWELRSLLNVPESADILDLGNALALGRMLPSQRQARAGALIRHERFQHWLQSAGSVTG
ncbi:hypothetical protein BST61_g11255 [Cercospora zeina]